MIPAPNQSLISNDCHDIVREERASASPKTEPFIKRADSPTGDPSHCPVNTKSNWSANSHISSLPWEELARRAVTRVGVLGIQETSRQSHIWNLEFSMTSLDREIYQKILRTWANLGHSVDDVE